MILFLDFDGVLHPHPKGAGSDVSVFCRIELLWQILQACPETRVVFSSSWRETYDFEYLVDFVTYGGGEHLAERFIGATPNLEAEGRRDLEIQCWLDESKYSGPWLALDDSLAYFSGGHPNLYLVDGDHGLADADVLAIIGRLQLSTDDGMSEGIIDQMNKTTARASTAIDEALVFVDDLNKRIEALESAMRDHMDGAFIETAFTAEEVERAIAEEERMGLRDTPCAFLNASTANSDQR